MFFARMFFGVLPICGYYFLGYLPVGQSGEKKRIDLSMCLNNTEAMLGRNAGSGTDC
jgi:hypothetical protein